MNEISPPAPLTSSLTCRHVRFAVFGYLCLLGLVLALLPADILTPLFAEGSIVERGSTLAWLVSAALLLPRCRTSPRRAWPLVMMFCLFAAREADLHKAYTGDSFLKTGFYQDGMGTLQWAMLPVAIAIFLLGLLIFFQHARALYREHGWRVPAGQWLIAAWLTGGLTKLFDRLPALLRHKAGITLPDSADLLMTGLEEGLELLLPALFLAALFLTPSFLTKFRS